jgi:hypothetical protein
LIARDCRRSLSWFVHFYTEQSDLFGQILPSKPTDRLFFALFPNEEAIPQIVKASQQLRDQHGLMGKSLSNDRLHVTLHHVGDYAGGLPNGLVEAAQDFVLVHSLLGQTKHSHLGVCTSLMRKCLTRKKSTNYFLKSKFFSRAF